MGRNVLYPGSGDTEPAIKDAAHLYLSYGLRPVPAWAVRPGGACCCPRGTGCERPGKHPRSVHTVPGPRGYSWKPLACATHAEIERRFASAGQYATANLMLAIPEGMLVIDQDFDDGGRQALTALASELGDLPATLSHRTPHGTHLIYRTPPGWTTRAWVGKDPRNPVPAGLDLRVPGQILMASPSRVPADAGLSIYGPITVAAVADLPTAYVTAWTPPKELRRTARPQAVVPPDRADAAASYVNARINGIAEDLAALKPGGRNTAIYTAALKVGSTLGAARSTPGAEHAADAWTDEDAEDALMAAAERNGYIASHSTAAARSAIRSGLRNGLRSPRPLPDFISRAAAYRRLRENAGLLQRPDPSTPVQAEARSASAVRIRATEANDRVASAQAVDAHHSGAVRGNGWASAKLLRDAGFAAQGTRPGELRGQTVLGDWRDAIATNERETWRPRVASPEGELSATPEDRAAEIGG
jgi:hypothetical protein